MNKKEILLELEEMIADLELDITRKISDLYSVVDRLQDDESTDSNSHPQTK